MGGVEGSAGFVVGEELMGLLVALADASDVAWEFVRFLVLLVEVFGQRGAVAGDAVSEFLDRGEHLDNLVEDRRGDGWVAGAGGSNQDVLGAELEEDAV